MVKRWKTLAARLGAVATVTGTTLVVGAATSAHVSALVVALGGSQSQHNQVLV
jgi:hypothetical protein